MKKNMFIIGLVALTFTSVTYTGEINDEFGAETIAGENVIGYAHVHNNNNNPVWAALVTSASIAKKGGEAAQQIKVDFIPARPTKARPGKSAMVSLPITSNEETILAVWRNNPRDVTVSKGMFYGTNINPKPTMAYKFSLLPNKRQIFLEIDDKITEQE